MPTCIYQLEERLAKSHKITGIRMKVAHFFILRNGYPPTLEPAVLRDCASIQRDTFRRYALLS